MTGCVHKVRWSVKRPEDCRFRLSVSHYKDRIVAPDEYSGATVVTPSDQTQVLQTRDRLVRDDITVTGITGTQVIRENGTHDVVGDKSVVVDVWQTEYSDDIDDFSGGNIRALISHAHEYIDTGYYPNIDVEMRLKIENNAYSNQYGGLCCAAFESSRIGCQFLSSNTSVAQFFTTLTANYSGTIGVSISNPFWIRPLILYQTPEQALRPLIIFYVYRGTGYDRKGGMTFHGLKCYEFGKLVKKYVPWLDGNGVPCVHELVDDEYFYNVGTGAFGYIDLEGNVHDT